MTTLKRVRVGWTGFPGAPGVSTFYKTGTGGMTSDLHDFFDALKDILPADVHIQVENAGDLIDSVTGDLTGSWGDDVVAEVVGTGTSTYPAPVGGMVGWETETILHAHRLRGKTYIVPLGGDSYQTDGSLAAGKITVLLDAGIALVATQGGSMVVWQRPRAAKAADGSRKAVEARDGGYGVVTVARVPDKSVVLRSRRD